MDDLAALLGTIGAVALAAVPLGVTVWALLDCARRPGWAWALAGRQQAGWLAAILCGALLVPVGLVISLIYLTRIRPSVARAENGEVPGQ